MEVLDASMALASATLMNISTRWPGRWRSRPGWTRSSVLGIVVAGIGERPVDALQLRATPMQLTRMASAAAEDLLWHHRHEM